MNIMNTPDSILYAASERWLEREKKRVKNIQGIENKNVFETETPERIKKRLDHLANINLKSAFQEKKITSSPSLIHNIGLERVIGNDDFLGIDFLELGLAVSRSVCKVNIYETSRRFAGSGTGFMVSPNLMMTNNHVLPDASTAKYSNAEFDYQLDSSGKSLPSVFFTLEPSKFFLTDLDLDYTLVAVSGLSNNGVPLSGFGWNKLMGEGKALIGDPLNIIQHPNGEYKQIVLQSNELVDLLPIHAHYLTDTRPGSSGSLVCNNQWEVVALHHSGVPKVIDGNFIDIYGNPWNGQDRSIIAWIANEGIRVSRLIKDIENQTIPLAWEKQRKELLEAVPPHPIELSNTTNQNSISQKFPKHSGSNIATLHIPLKVTFSIGDPVPSDAANIDQLFSPIDETPIQKVNMANTDTLDILVEKNVVPYMDSDYSTRKGYDEKFLGPKVELPKISDPNTVSFMDNGAYVIPYHHFSLVMNKERRLAYYCASNVDGSKKNKQPEVGKIYTRKSLAGMRDNDREAWLTDPRIPESHQLPDKFYNRDRKSFDKGHIIRRDDVAWGSTYEEVRIANGDTFHTTNCSPQVADYNRSPGIWGNFENHLLREAKDEKLIVFSGPVFSENDRIFEGFDHRGKIKVQIPKAFWKVVISSSGESIKTYAFLFEQDLINVDWEEKFAVKSDFKKHQLKVSALEQRLENISFDEQLHETDQMVN